jgi:hypothetical protein
VAKLTLKLESLHVDSFDTVAVRGNARGTVRGAESEDHTYLTCAPCGSVVVGGGSGAYTCGCATVACDPNSGPIRCFNNTLTGS